MNARVQGTARLERRPGRWAAAAGDRHAVEMAMQALFFPAPGGGPIYGRLREQDAGVGRWGHRPQDADGPGRGGLG